MLSTDGATVGMARHNPPPRAGPDVLDVIESTYRGLARTRKSQSGGTRVLNDASCPRQGRRPVP